MSKNNFTFCDLIAVLVCLFLILGILPQITAHDSVMIEKSRCINNLKSLYSAMRMYADDNDNFSAGSRTNSKAWTDPRFGAAMTWKSFLVEGGYVDYPGNRNRSIFACPDRPDKMRGNFYTDMQNYGTWHIKGIWGDFVKMDGSAVKLYGQQASDGSYDKIHTPLKLNKQPFQPSEFNLISDTKSVSTKQFGQWFYATRTVMAKDFSGGEGVIALPHSGRSNMVFADGHAASLDANELNELGWLKSRRWIPEAKIRK